MASNFTPDLKRMLKNAGCELVRAGKGDPEIWHTPGGKRFVVDSKIKSRHTANAVLQQAGLSKAF